MANYYGTSRTGYFLPKDDHAFTAWANTLPGEVTVIERFYDGQLLRGLLFSQGLPSWRDPVDGDDASAGDAQELDVLEELAAHVAPGWQCLYIEIGNEKMRYLVGAAARITCDGVEHFDLSQWLAENPDDLMGLAPQY